MELTGPEITAPSFLKITTVAAFNDDILDGRQKAAATDKAASAR